MIVKTDCETDGALHSTSFDTRSKWADKRCVLTLLTLHNTRAWNVGKTQVREGFTITEKAFS